MAFAQTGNNLSQGNFSPEIFSQKVLKFFRRESTVEAITNTDYYGEISNYGDSVRIINEPTVTISDYARGQVVVTQDLDDAAQNLTIDTAKVFSFKIDDIEDKHANVNWTDLATSSGAYALKDDYDRLVMQKMALGATGIYGTTGGGNINVGHDTATATTINPLDVMSRMSRLLNEANVPRDNRWLVASPEFWESVEASASQALSNDYVEKGTLANGLRFNGLMRGFKCYTSNNVPNTGAVTDGVNAAVAGEDSILAGHMSAVATASQITKVETIRSENTFADITRGLHLYGSEVLRGNAMVRAIVEYV